MARRPANARPAHPSRKSSAVSDFLHRVFTFVPLLFTLRLRPGERNMLDMGNTAAQDLRRFLGADREGALQ